MGHEVITFAGQHGVFHDMDLWTLRHFFVTEAKALVHAAKTPEAEAAVAFFEGWDWLGPGVYTGIDFEVFVASPAHFATLHRVIESARKKISDFGALIPLEYLKTHVNAPTAYFTADQPTDRFCGEIDRLVTLLKKTPHRPLQPTGASAGD